MKPLDFLEPVLHLLHNNLDVLPAVGGAVEDLLRPDVDEIEDMLINAESREVTDFLETPTPVSFRQARLTFVLQSVTSDFQVYIRRFHLDVDGVHCVTTPQAA